MVNPKKIYCIDNGLVKTNSVSFSNDHGRLLENMVFMQLRRASGEIYYFSEKNECDFVVFKQKKPDTLIQVCWQLDHENIERELSGLLEAMDYFDLNKGIIITASQTDSFVMGSKTAIVLPFHDWVME